MSKGEFMAAFIKMLFPLVSAFAGKKEVKEFVVYLLEKYTKTTDNDIDDKIVAMVRKALLG